jgi:hypothetical protein
MSTKTPLPGKFSGYNLVIDRQQIGHFLNLYSFKIEFLSPIYQSRHFTTYILAQIFTARGIHSLTCISINSNPELARVPNLSNVTNM